MSEIKKTYHSPFKRICVTEDGGKKIKELQEEFDKFWRKVNRVADKSPEKYHAMKAFQEACMWLTRGCALKNERVAKPIINDEPVRVDPIEFKPFKVSDVFGKLPNYKEGETISSNGARIIYKPKK